MAIQPPPVAPAGGMAATVEEFLAEYELSRYAEAFDEHGWDSLLALRNISDADLVQLESSVAMKIGHSSRLRAALGKVAAPPAPAAPAAPAAPVAPPPVPDEAGAGAAAAVEPPVHAADGADAAAAAIAGAAALQKQLHDKLTKTDMLGAALMHGTTFETYQAPAEFGGALMITMTADNKFYCHCCPIPSRLAASVGARAAGISLCNLLSHMGTKEHWTNFRRVVFKKDFDQAEWLRYTGGNQHGPDRAKRSTQGKDRAAAAELKREHKKPRSAATPPPPTSGASTPGGIPPPAGPWGPSPSPLPGVWSANGWSPDTVFDDSAKLAQANVPPMGMPPLTPVPLAPPFVMAAAAAATGVPRPLAAVPAAAPAPMELSAHVPVVAQPAPANVPLERPDGLPGVLAQAGAVAAAAAAPTAAAPAPEPAPAPKPVDASVQPAPPTELAAAAAPAAAAPVGAANLEPAPPAEEPAPAEVPALAAEPAPPAEELAPAEGRAPAADEAPAEPPVTTFDVELAPANEPAATAEAATKPAVEPTAAVEPFAANTAEPAVESVLPDNLHVGMRLEVQGCDEKCPIPCLDCAWDVCKVVVVRRRGLQVDVKIDEDGMLCERVPRRFLRPLQPQEASAAQPAAEEANSAEPLHAEEAPATEAPQAGEAPDAALPQAEEAPATQPLLLGFGASLTGGKAHASTANRAY